MGRRLLAAVVALTTAVVVAGCGLGPGPGSSAVDLRVTEGFGARTLTTATTTAHGLASELALLRRHGRVTSGAGREISTAVTSSGVTSVNGHAGDWMYWVNGIQPTRTAALTRVYKGDHVWWDLHPTGDVPRIPAVVGSFPEPFRHGLEGKRYPSTIECGGEKSACAAITAEFTRLHIPLSPSGAGYGSGTDSLSINVGTWEQLATEVVGGLIGKGPEASGVYAHFIDRGHRLEILDADGHVARTLGPGSGLIAATAGPSDVPTWVVAGTDRAGVAAAARALTAPALAGHLALAVSAGRHYPVPAAGR